MRILIIFLSLISIPSLDAMQKEEEGSRNIRFLYGIKRPVCYDDPETFNGNCERFSQKLTHKVNAYGQHWKKLGRAESESGIPCTINRLVIRKDTAPYTQEDVARALLKEIAANHPACNELRVQFAAMQDALMKQLAADKDGKVKVILPVRK